MRKIQHDNIRSIAVKQDALNEIYTHFDEFHKTTVFQEECRSWFKDGKIKNRIYLWPGPVSAVVLRIHRAISPPGAAAQPRYPMQSVYFHHQHLFSPSPNGAS